MEKVAYSSLLKTTRDGRINPVESSKLKVQSYWIIIFGILLLAAFLRIYRIQDYMTFLGDEGRDVLWVYKILHGDLTLLGPTASVGGFFLGPIYYYFMAPFLWVFNYNPVGPAVMVALFGTATVWLVYKVGNEFLGVGVGSIAAILYGISPLVIAYSRSSWNPNLMPFFSLLSLYILYKAINRDKARLFVLCGFLLGISMQLHYLATFLGVIVGVYVLLSRSILARGYSLQKSIIRVFKDYFYILMGFIVGWLPFLLFEIRHGFPNFQSIINFIFQSGDTGIGNRFFETIYNVFFRLFARLIANFPPPEQVALGAHPNIALWYYATVILGVVSISILAYRFLKTFKDQENFRKNSLLVLWFVIGIGLFGFYKKPIYDYYFGFMFPLPFMLVGLTIVNLYTNTHELTFSRHSGERSDSRISNADERFWTSQNDGKWGLVVRVFAVGIFLTLLWINLQGIPFRFPPNRQLAQVEEISRFVVEKTDGKSFNFALITGGNSDHAYRYFFTIWNREPLTIENPQKDPKRETVTDQLLVICETNPCAPLGNSLWEVAGFGRGEIVGEWDVSVVKVIKLRHYRGV